MSLLLRWFSPAYRSALQAEAEGRYIEAARAYALCDQRLKVAEMHLLEAELRGAPASSLRELHIAAHFVDKRNAASQALRLRLGRLYLRVLKKSALTSVDQELCGEAAALLLAAGDAESAGAAYELGGDLEHAAAAYQQAGDIDRVEELLGTLESRRQASSQWRQTLKTYQMQMDLGQRDSALRALQKYAATTTDAGEAQRLLFDLQARLLPPFQVQLGETIYVGRFPWRLGRPSGSDDAPTLPLLDTDLSRDHARIECVQTAAEVQFQLRDMNSKYGTTLAGLPIGGTTALPLRGEGEIGLGPTVRLQFSVLPQQIVLGVARGLSRGLRALGSFGPIALADGIALDFFGEAGQPRLRRIAESAALLLNGKRAPSEIQLLRGDNVEFAGRVHSVK